MPNKNLLVELLVEELPPKALRKLGHSFARLLAESLQAQGLCAPDAAVGNFASPRRLAAHIGAVAERAADRSVAHKLMPVSVGLDAAGNPTPALLKRLLALGADASAVGGLTRGADGKSEVLFHHSVVAGASLKAGLQKALEEALAKLPIPKQMTYQPERDCELPGWSSVSFVRPAHGLVAVHGSAVVDVRVLGLRAGNTTLGHRFEALLPAVLIDDADRYASALERDGAVVADFETRKQLIRQQLVERAPAGHFPLPDMDGDIDDALLEEVTALVERPNVLLCEFDAGFLDVPQECLILTMKANQKYFPLFDSAGRLTNKFLVVSNISPADASLVVRGNERVVRPRLADAQFFYAQDRRASLRSRLPGLGKVVYHNKLGSQAERMERVRAIARAIGTQLGGAALAEAAYSAATLAKADLLTDMVGEFPELQGVMGAYYARHDGESDDIAMAIEDHYKPRFAGDTLPRNPTGLVVALADKIETLVGMFAIGSLPTGDKDPFALRRHALGVIRILSERELALSLDAVLATAVAVLHAQVVRGLASAAEMDAAVGLSAVQPGQWRAVKLHFGGDAKHADDEFALRDFIYDRLGGSLRDQGYRAQEVDAVLALHPQHLGEIPKRLAAVRAFSALPQASALAAANKRIANILKKTQEADPHVSELLLGAPAEIDLYRAMQRVSPEADRQFEAGDYTVSLQTLAALREPVDAFFDSVMVNAPETDLRLNRLGLLRALHLAMNRVADLSRLAGAEVVR